MGRPSRNRITGGDGYAELEASEAVQKSSKSSYSSPREDLHKEKSKEVFAQRKRDAKKRERASKTLKNYP